MTTEKRKSVLLSTGILAAMLVCAFFMLRHSPHHFVFSMIFFGLMFANAWLQYSRNNRAMPSPLTRLFPESAATAKERS